MSLIGWWPLHRTEGKAVDMSGNGNHGTHKGTTRGVAGKAGLQATSFDGNDDYIIIPNQGAFDGSFTLCGWMNITDKSSDSALATGDKNIGGGSMQWALWYDTNNSAFRVYDSSNSVFSQTDASENIWYFLTWSHNNGTSDLYVNGVKEGSGSLNPSSSASEDIIGAGDKNTKFMTGKIAGVRVYDRALSSSEIQTLYEWGSKTGVTNPQLHNGRDSGAVARYTLDGSAEDVWGANNGTNNGVTFVDDSIRGQAGDFQSGNTDRITVSDSSIFDTDSSGLTVCAWVKLEGESNSGRVVTRQDLTDFHGWTLRFDQDNSFRWRVNGDSSIVDTFANKPTLNNWVHAVGTVDENGNLRCYANGVLRDEGSSPGNYNTNADVGIGARAGDRNSPFDGKIDDVRIYNRALSPSEVQQLYQWGTKGIDMRRKLVNKR